jgi:hypothetical protein
MERRELPEIQMTLGACNSVVEVVKRRDGDAREK